MHLTVFGTERWYGYAEAQVRHLATCHPSTCHPSTCHPSTCHPQVYAADMGAAIVSNSWGYDFPGV